MLESPRSDHALAPLEHRGAHYLSSIRLADDDQTGDKMAADTGALRSDRIHDAEVHRDTWSTCI